MRPSAFHLMPALAFFLLIQFTAFSQGIVEVQSTDGPTFRNTLQVKERDSLIKIAGDLAKGHPYYTHLWIFGDGTFINGTTDSIQRHVYQNALNTTLLAGGSPGADVTVYMTGNYSGGSKPPKKMNFDPNDLGRSPSKAHSFITPARLAIDTAAIPYQAVVVPFNNNSPNLKLQLNNDGTLPGDTMATIISFRQIAKLDPPQLTRGQVFLFYNSKVIKGAPQKNSSFNGLFKNVSPATPAPPALAHGNSHYRRSLLHFQNTDTLGNLDLTPTETPDFHNVLVWNYTNLPEAGAGNEVRNVFAELANDATMQALFNEASNFGDTLRFLAVMTFLDTFNVDGNPELNQLPNLPASQQAYLDSLGIGPLLNSSFYLNNDLGFVPLQQATQMPLVSKIVGFDEVRSPVVAAHDPNNLSLYSCKCPADGHKKIVGVITFSNDGGKATSQLKVVLHVPEQLNMNSLEDISMAPNPDQPEFRVGAKDLEKRTITWEWAGLLQTAQEAGVGHASTKGEIVFAIQLKEGFELSDMDSMLACITFDNGEEMCTLPVSHSGIITTNVDDQASSELECQDCKSFEAEKETVGCACDTWCLMIVAVGLFIFLVVLWFLKKFLANQ